MLKKAESERDENVLKEEDATSEVDQHSVEAVDAPASIDIREPLFLSSRPQDHLGNRLGRQGEPAGELTRLHPTSRLRWKSLLIRFRQVGK